MTLKDKQELVRLLNVYCEELCQDNDYNVTEMENRKERGYGFPKFGIKSQYEHARIIAAKLSREIGNELSSYWDIN